jgi:hypothetical protein
VACLFEIPVQNGEYSFLHLIYKSSGVACHSSGVAISNYEATLATVI